LNTKANITVKEKRMNDEYLQAKFNLCIDQAEKNIQEQDVANAIKNLERANRAMARLFGLEEEGENE
jgi:ribosomal protein RSM22 (predicted rRNA methylase)